VCRAVRIASETVSRRTGSTVLLVDNRDESFEAMGDDGLGNSLLPCGRWATVCDTHGNYVLHSTRRIAESFVPVPDQFCEECRTEDDEPAGAGADPFGRPDPRTHPEYWTE
jgi:hypothetical protein